MINRRNFIKISGSVFLSTVFAGRITMANRNIKSKSLLLRLQTEPQALRGL